MIVVVYQEGVFVFFRYSVNEYVKYVIGVAICQIGVDQCGAGNDLKRNPT